MERSQNGQNDPNIGEVQKEETKEKRKEKNTVKKDCDAQQTNPCPAIIIINNNIIISKTMGDLIK